ncbi:hypothetical protein [Jeotgalibaca caeni]|uniref:hypothetical protein n=1 Tax=Jeotgalibaca caeni TaxID=3028623 RepID=UPI00237D41CA|nr:hypothetical protein [Jeotgalibaca caeni]MDE1549839.1 hypothetical protein [Jeotgalibaca caeni]
MIPKLKAITNSNYYLVRIGNGERISDIIKNNLVAIGWSEVDFSSFSDMDALKKAVTKKYYSQRDIKPQVLGRKLSQIEKFYTIEKGAVILVPYGKQIVLARSKGNIIYNQTDKGYDLANQLEVEYLKKSDGELKSFSRDILS